ncbi:Transmembrane domain-containing protein [Spironucleus salmonicida]|uniref:Transmembrane domain-containing protein n=1 Tax=Spironucleus salmonicida TaxID=348837 RepID=V6LWF3_9EUKA|nr:Transmembrane domain-containing protein [Spironucleus salmonicida]|eukprot:EST48578.1 Transmembrane domain-containing protein [Spironucleus salmonicida]
MGIVVDVIICLFLVLYSLPASYYAYQQGDYRDLLHWLLFWILTTLLLSIFHILPIHRLPFLSLGYLTLIVAIAIFRAQVFKVFTQNDDIDVIQKQLRNLKKQIRKEKIKQQNVYKNIFNDFIDFMNEI